MLLGPRVQSQRSIIIQAPRTDREILRATRPFMKELRWRSWVHVAVAVGVLAGLLALTTLDMHWAGRVGCGLLAALATVRLFVLYHDHQHGAILRRSLAAKVVMGAYGMLTLSPGSPWNRSHNYHHANNSKILGSSIGSYPIMTTEAYARASRKDRLLYAAARHPLTILFGYLTVFLYGMCMRPFATNPKLHWDCAVALALHGALVALLAVVDPAALLFTVGIPMFVSSAIGAYLFYAQHNFPEVKLKARSDWTHSFASLNSSSFMALGPLGRWFTANIGYHHVHHLNPRIPFYRLPEAMAAIPELQSPGRTSLSFRQIYRCLRLKLWDPERNCMVTFRGTP